MRTRTRTMALFVALMLLAAVPAVARQDDLIGSDLRGDEQDANSVEFDGERGRAFVATGVGAVVRVVPIDPSEPITSIDVGGAVYVITISSDGQSLHAVVGAPSGVAGHDRVVEVDLETLEITRTLERAELGVGDISDVQAVGDQLFVAGATERGSDDDRLMVVQLQGEPMPTVVATRDVVGVAIRFASAAALAEPTSLLYVSGLPMTGALESIVSVFDATDLGEPVLRREGMTDSRDFVLSVDGTRLWSYDPTTYLTADLSESVELSVGQKWSSPDPRFVYTSFGRHGREATLSRSDLTGQEHATTTRINCPGGDVRDLRVVDDTVVVIVGLGVCIFPVPSLPAVELTDRDATTTGRIDGDDPTSFAVRVSQLRFPESSAVPYAVLTRDDTFADSLAGAVLTRDAPLLFTGSDDLPDATMNELQRVIDGRGIVYILGGTNAISADVEELLAQTFTVRRLAGADRTETSTTIAREALRLYGGAPMLLVARSDAPAENPTAAWADSIAAGAAAARTGSPIVLTPTGALDADVELLLRTRNDYGRVVIVGGFHAVSLSTEVQIEAIPGVRQADRSQGANRAGTATQLSQDLFGVYRFDGGQYLAVFNGYDEDGWAYGLAGAGAASDLGASLVMVSDTIPPETAAYVGCPTDVEMLVFGNSGQVSDQVVTQLDTLPCDEDRGAVAR